MPISSLQLQGLDESLLPHAVALDQRALGGLWSLDGYRQELVRSSSRLVGLVSQVDLVDNMSEPRLLGIGCLWGIEDEAHIILLAVDPAYRRQGFGKMLLYGMLAIASRQSLVRATLEVRATNQAAISLYEKFGFQVAGRRKGYYSETGEDALILWLGKMQTPAFQATLQDWRPTIEQQLESHGWHPTFTEI